MITVLWWLTMHSRPWLLQCSDCMRKIGINIYMLLLILQLLLIEQLTSILVDSNDFLKDFDIEGVGGNQHTQF
ncbi:Uncharacterized protein APZ42_012366 [Daphnia magna]|uniref:Uncharacterized protein n=1 Tax=Daphnia magna TaxID=35525 RepID=A0A162RWI4_9CRUS|nr:Uncharacterized protein APZ42_012366 [Daphnia magna]